MTFHLYLTGINYFILLYIQKKKKKGAKGEGDNSIEYYSHIHWGFSFYMHYIHVFQ